MDRLKYAEMVIEQAHIRALRGELQWTIGQNRISADLTSSINVSMKFEDDGLYSAIWEYVSINHPVGSEMTLIGNPDSKNARLSTLFASGSTLEKVNAIFRYVLLDTREKQFEMAMKELAG